MTPARAWLADTGGVESGDVMGGVGAGVVGKELDDASLRGGCEGKGGGSLFAGGREGRGGGPSFFCGDGDSVSSLKLEGSGTLVAADQRSIGLQRKKERKKEKRKKERKKTKKELWPTYKMRQLWGWSEWHPFPQYPSMRRGTLRRSPERGDLPPPSSVGQHSGLTPDQNDTEGVFAEGSCALD